MVKQVVHHLRTDSLAIFKLWVICGFSALVEKYFTTNVKVTSELASKPDMLEEFLNQENELLTIELHSSSDMYSVWTKLTGKKSLKNINLRLPVETKDSGAIHILNDLVKMKPSKLILSASRLNMETKVLSELKVTSLGLSSDFLSDAFKLKANNLVTLSLDNIDMKNLHEFPSLKVLMLKRCKNAASIRTPWLSTILIYDMEVSKQLCDYFFGLPLDNLIWKNVELDEKALTKKINAKKQVVIEWKNKIKEAVPKTDEDVLKVFLRGDFSNGRGSNFEWIK